MNYEDSTNYGCLDPIVFLDGIEANEMLKSVFDEIKSLKIIIILKRQFIKLFLIRLKNAKMAKVGSLNVIEKLQNNEDEHVKMQAIYYLKNAKQYFKTCF